MLKLLINLVLFAITFFAIRFIIKSHSTKLKKILKIILFLIAIWTICFCTDYILAKNQKLPLFCSKLFGIFSYQDGGTIEYIGLGYKVIDFHKIVYHESGWYDTFKFEKKYICLWNVSYTEALNNSKKVYSKDT